MMCRFLTIFNWKYIDLGRNLPPDATNHAVQRADLEGGHSGWLDLILISIEIFVELKQKHAFMHLPELIMRHADYVDSSIEIALLSTYSQLNSYIIRRRH